MDIKTLHETREQLEKQGLQLEKELATHRKQVAAKEELLAGARGAYSVVCGLIAKEEKLLVAAGANGTNPAGTGKITPINRVAAVEPAAAE